MPRRRTRESDETEINLTPMLDIVFIMLIFFIVTASFVREAGIDVNRPDAQTSESKRANILIAISDTGQVWIQKRQIDLRAVRANVERLMAENPQASVVIQADEGSKTGILVEVMDQARLAGAFNVAIAAERNE